MLNLRTYVEKAWPDLKRWLFVQKKRNEYSKKQITKRMAFYKRMAKDWDHFGFFSTQS